MLLLGDVVNTVDTIVSYIMIVYKKLSLYNHKHIQMDDFVSLQVCFSNQHSRNAIDRLYSQFTNKDFDLDTESAKRHIQYDRNPLHYIVTSQIKDAKLWFLFRTLIQNPSTLRHRDQVYGRYPIHYIASNIHYRYASSNHTCDYHDEILFLFELGRLCYCGFEDNDTVYSKSVKHYMGTKPKLLTVMTRMYDKVTQKIQKRYRLKRWYGIVKVIEYLPPNGHFQGGIEFQRCHQHFLNQCRME